MSEAMRPVGVEAQPELLRVHWADGTVGEYASVWLRDNVAEDRDAHSGQRLVDVADLPARPRLASAVIAEGAVRVTWAEESRATSYAADWLHAQAAGLRRPEQEVRHWLDGAGRNPAVDCAWLDYALLGSSDSERLRWLTRLVQEGIAFLSGVPAVDEGILDAMRLVGRVADTNYGLVFDVRAVARPENLAYSDLGLGLHTDNPYREPVPGFQALHTLVAAPDGGDSLFVDGYALAEHLRQSAPDVFETLTRTPVPFGYRSADAELYAQRPLIALDCTGQVAAVHYNNRSIGPLTLPPAACREFYAAYRHWALLLRETRFQLRMHLERGELVVFDNRRVLHGRTGFRSARHPRHLRGCYLTRDSVHGEAALLRRRLMP